MKKLIALAILFGSVCYGRAQVFSCSSFNSGTSGACSAAYGYGTPATDFWLRGGANNDGVTVGPEVSGSQILLVPVGSRHAGWGMFYKSPVDARAFTSKFTFIPDDWNFAFVVQNATYPAGYINQDFTAGAGCEGGFYQATNVGPTNNTFAMEFSLSDKLQASDPSYTYSNVQIYQQQQIPCNPDEAFPIYWSTTKYSTSPVPLSSPVSTNYSTSGDTYTAMVSYDGSNFSLCMYDVTLAVGSCSSSTSGTGTYYQHTWSNVAIPAYLDSTTGYVGLMSGVGSGSPQEPSQVPLYVNAFTYTVGTASASPGTTAPVNGAPATANPTFSPAPGSYSGVQSVTISSTTGSSYSCYVLSATTCTGAVTPIPDNYGACGVGTLYSSPVSVPASQTLCARSGTNYGGTMPSGLVSGAYIIGAGTGPNASITGKASVTRKVAIQ